MDMYFFYTIFALLAGNILTWTLVINFFNVQSLWQRILLVWIILFLGSSSLMSFLWVHKKDTKLVRLYYFISASWMGLVLNFLLSAAAVGLIYLAASIFSLPITLFHINILTLASTIFLTIVSFRNAFEISVKRDVVKIKNLPQAWEGKRIVHISDVHLGPILRQDFFHKVIRRIEDLKPDAVFITGDLFDGAESDFSWVKSPLNNLNPPFGVYYSFGNHDFSLGHERVSDLLKAENINILDNRLIEKEGVQIIGLNFTPDRNFDLKRAVLASTGYQPAKPSIVLFHEPKDTSKLKGIGVDLLLSGHTHGGQMFPFNYLASYFYHHHSHGIYRDMDFTLCVSSGVGTWGPPMRTGSKSEIIELTLHKK